MEWNERPGHIKWRGSCLPACTYLGRIGASGKMIGFYDLIVGATALERGNQVATFNKRHFSQIRGPSAIEPK